MTTARSLLMALLAPLLYLMAAAFLAALVAYPASRLLGLEDISDLRSLVSRGGQALLLLGLWPIGRRLGWDLRTWGLGARPVRQWLIGFGLGGLMLAGHVFLLVQLDIRAVVWDRWTAAYLAPVLAKAFGIGLGIGLIEETLFRGALVAGLRQAAGPVAAVIISAFYFAILHFIGSRWTAETGIDWTTGFRIALDGFARVSSAPADAFLGLFVAGLLLATLRTLWPRSLALCMGIHAGWIFIIKSAKPLTWIDPESPRLYLIGPYDYFVGYLSAAWLGSLLLLMLAGRWLWQKNRTRDRRP